MPVALTPELLEELEQRLSAGAAVILTRLRSGLSLDQVQELTGAAGLELPEEAQTWWQWRDGVAGTDPGSWRGEAFGMKFFPYSLAEAIQTYRRNLAFAARAADQYHDADYWWDPQWFPVLKLQAGDIACECTEPSREHTPLRAIQPAKFDTDAFRTVIAGSLGALVEGWLQAIDRGWWVLVDGLWQWEGDDQNPMWRAGLI